MHDARLIEGVASRNGHHCHKIVYYRKVLGSRHLNRYSHVSLVDSSIAMLGRLLLLLTSAAALRIAPLRPVEVHARHAAPVASIAVFGASGATGSEAVLQALERGEDVTCLVRDRSKLNAPRSAAGFREVR